MSINERFEKLNTEVTEELANLRAEAHVAKLTLLEGWDKVEDVFEQLKEEKDVARVKMHILKLEALDGLDGIAEKFEEIIPSKEEIIIQMHLAKLGVLEEWDELEEKFALLKGKAKGLTEDGLKASYKLGDEIRTGIESLRTKF